MNPNMGFGFDDTLYIGPNPRLVVLCIGSAIVAAIIIVALLGGFSFHTNLAQDCKHNVVDLGGDKIAVYIWRNSAACVNYMVTQGYEYKDLKHSSKDPDIYIMEKVSLLK